ncbi:hypothetical protein PFISCL1PPCAC_5856, partial [Pristionchus fissidentatus]
LFPGYATKSDSQVKKEEPFEAEPPSISQPSSSRNVVKKEEPEEEDRDRFSSFRIAAAAREKAQRQAREKMNAKIQQKKAKAASIRFNLGDTTDEEDGMLVDASDCDDEDVKRITEAQKRKKENDEALERRKRSNRERRDNFYERTRQQDKVKKERESSSDSDHERKRKKIKKEHDRYIEPEKSKPQYKRKHWDFLATVGVTLNNPDSYMMNDGKADEMMHTMDKFGTREQSQYHQRFTCTLGGNYKINKLFYPTKTMKKSGRIFDHPIKMGDKPEQNFLTYHHTSGDIPLSTVRCDEQIEYSHEPSAEREEALRRRAEQNMQIAIESDPVRKKKNIETKLAMLQKEQMETNSKLKTDMKNEQLWIKFLGLEDQINKLGNNKNAPSGTQADRKMAILAKALANVPKSSYLLIELMKIKKEMNTNPAELSDEWKKIMNRLPNSIALWNSQIEELKHDGKQFTRTQWIDIAERARIELTGLVNGTLRSHRMEAGTERYLVSLMALRVRMEKEMGFIERSIAMTQSLIERSLFHPPMNAMDRFRPFEEVWTDNIPLIGEPNGKGWRHCRPNETSPASSEWLIEIKEAAEKYENKELYELGRAAKEEDKMVIFARHERIHEKYHWRPVRAEVGNPEEEVDRQVEFSELPDDFFSVEHHFDLIIKLMRELGAMFYEFTNDGWVDPVAPLLSSFGLLSPSLHSIPDGLPRFIDRMLDSMAFDDPERNWNNAITMSLARIRTQSWFISQREEHFDMAAVLKELTSLAESATKTYAVLNKNKNLSEMAALMYVFCAYEATNLFLANYEDMNQKTLTKSIKALVKSFTSRALVWSGKVPSNQINSRLNKSIVMALATLLVKLPGTWDERAQRVQQIVLGKDAKEEWMSITQQLEASRIVEKLRKETPLPAESEFHARLFSFFGPDKVQAGILETFFLFVQAARTSSPCPATALEIRRDIMQHFPECDQLYFEHYVHIMKHAKNSLHKYLVNALKNHTFTSSSFLTREYINTQQQIVDEVSLFSQLKERAEEQPSLFNSIARLYAHRKQFTRIVASAEMLSDLSIATRVVRVFVEEAKRHRDPTLWRYALNLTAEFKNKKMGEEVFTQAFADCSWSRDLHLDYMIAFPEEGQLLSFHEKHIRTRSDPGIVQTLIDYADKKDEEKRQTGDAEMT